MTHYKMLVYLLAFALAPLSTIAQHNSRALLFSPNASITDTLDGTELFYAQNAYSLKAGLSYVQDGDFGICVGGGYQVPVGDVTANDKQLVAGVEAALHYSSFNNDNFSNNVTRGTVSPFIARVCNFSENVDMRGGVSVPIGFGRSSSEFDGISSSKDNLFNIGINFDFGVAYRFQNGAFVSAETSIAGISRSQRTSVDNPDISVSNSSFWAGFNKNNSLNLAYNIPIGGDNMRR